MKSRNLINSFSERIRTKVNGWNKKTVQYVSYTAIFVAVSVLVAASYVGVDETTQISLPGANVSDNININLLQGQKVDQFSQANAVAASVSESAGVQIASGAVATAPTTTADDVKAANVASTVASVVNLSSSNSVSSSAESANISAEMAQADATSVSKGQIIEPTTESKALITYTVQEGDNVDTVAAEHGVSNQTIRWANRLKDSNLAPGSTITIPAVDGVVYTMKDGDTLAGVADKYKSDVEAIITINNLESEAVPAGSVILLPDGILPETERPEYVAPVINRRPIGSGSSTSTRSNLRVPAIGGNRYAYGYCTWYAYNRRVQLGLPVANGWGNANTWDTRAASQGYRVSTIPSVGAIFQTDGGYYGHVGIVERVNPDGSIYVSEMNYQGWNVISNRTITNLAGYEFIQ